MFSPQICSLHPVVCPHHVMNWRKLLGSQSCWRAINWSLWPRTMTLHHGAPQERAHHCRRRGRAAGGQDGRWSLHTSRRAADTHSSLWHIRHLLRSALPSGLLTGSLLVGQENFPLRKSDQIFMHSFWKAQRRTVSRGSLRGHQDPENSSFTFKFFWVGCVLSTPIVCLHQAWGYHAPHPHPSPRTTRGTGCTQRPACGSEARKDNEKVQNPLQGWLFMGKGVHI